MSKIVIAVPRGRITKECKNLLLKTSFAPDPLLFDKDTRKLTFKSKKRNIEYIKVRAFDACTFVAFGAAQIGIAGEDVINEFDYSEIYAPLDLNIGHCRISVAALKSLLKKEDPETWSNIRIASKYPNITKKFFYNKGIQVEIIKLSGSMELARYLNMCRRWRDIPKPTIAMVHGACVAGGCMLAWVCDLIIASEDAFFADPVVRMGIPGVEYFAHPYELNPRIAKEFLLSIFV